MAGAFLERGDVMSLPFKINNIAIEAPVKCQVSLSDIDNNSSNNAKGVMQRSRVRAGKRKVALSWKNLNATQAKIILDAAKDVFVTFYYFDPLLAEWTTKTFYAGDKSADMTYDGKNGFMWAALDFNLVEK